MKIEDLQAAYDRMKAAPPLRSLRIVGPYAYKQAQLAIAADATPREIEMCLAGASWKVVENQRLPKPAPEFRQEYMGKWVAGNDDEPPHP